MGRELTTALRAMTERGFYCSGNRVVVARDGIEPPTPAFSGLALSMLISLILLTFAMYFNVF